MTKASEDDHCKMQYFLGDFDGEKFLCTCPSDEPRWLDEGFDNYAAVTFQNAKDVLLMGWGMNLSLIHISEPTRQRHTSRMPSSA